MVLQVVKKFPTFSEPEGSSPYPQAPATCPYPEPTPSSPHNSLPLHEDPSSGSFCLQKTHLDLWIFLNMGFHGEALLAPRPTPKLEDHPSSAVRDCLFYLFAATLHIGGRSSIRNYNVFIPAIIVVTKHFIIFII